MTKWELLQLGDVATFHRGYDLPKSEMIEGPYPVIGSNGIIGWHNQYTTESPGITIGRSGNTGTPYYCSTPSWSHNTTLYIESYRDCIPRFIYYFLQTLKLNEYAGGSAVPTLNRNHIHTLPVCIPDLNTQEKISNILSVLDTKIELNNRINDYLAA